MGRPKKQESETSNVGLDIPKKLKKLLADDFYDIHSALTEEELKNRLAQYEQAMVEYEKARDIDTQIQALSEQLKELKEEYQIPIKEHQAKVRGVVKILEDRGVLESGIKEDE